MRRLPFVPTSTRELEVGDFWTVSLKGGDLGVMQVRELRPSGPGAWKNFVAGIIDWRGQEPPTAADLAGRRVLVQGLTRIEAFAQHGSQVLGTTRQTVAGPGLHSPLRHVDAGERTQVWAWKSLRRRVEAALAESADEAVDDEAVDDKAVDDDAAGDEAAVRLSDCGGAPPRP